MSFESLGLSADILRAVAEQQYTQPTPIQSQAVPVILEGRDILASAQTGTGKTAGFTLPLLQRLAADPTPGKERFVRALILAPTRELAAQVSDSVRTYGRYLPFRSTVVVGGMNMRAQIDKLRRGVDILIATPGRLLDLVDRREVDLSSVEILVLDEADRMLDMGFIHDIRTIIDMMPEGRQNLLFSATFSNEVKKLANTLLHKPAVINTAGNATTAKDITQSIIRVDGHRKRELLSHMIGSENLQQVLVFARTKYGAERLSKQLEEDGLSSTAIHGDKSQGARSRALADFKKGKARVLVATDVAARGLDIDKLSHVINFDLPDVPEDYVHRIGRTGRAGNSGKAISFVAAPERHLLSRIEAILKMKIKQETIEGYEPKDNGRGSNSNNNKSKPGGKTFKPKSFKPKSFKTAYRVENGKKTGDGKRVGGNYNNEDRRPRWTDEQGDRPQRRSKPQGERRAAWSDEQGDRPKRRAPWADEQSDRPQRRGKPQGEGRRAPWADDDRRSKRSGKPQGERRAAWSDEQGDRPKRRAPWADDQSDRPQRRGKPQGEGRRSSWSDDNGRPKRSGKPQGEGRRSSWSDDNGRPKRSGKPQGEGRRASWSEEGSSRPKRSGKPGGRPASWSDRKGSEGRPARSGKPAKKGAKPHKGGRGSNARSRFDDSVPNVSF